MLFIQNLSVLFDIVNLSNQILDRFTKYILYKYQIQMKIEGGYIKKKMY